MRKAAYITLGTSLVLFFLFLSIWFLGLVGGPTFGGLIHLLLPATIIPIVGFIIGAILLIITFVKK